MYSHGVCCVHGSLDDFVMRFKLGLEKRNACQTVIAKYRVMWSICYSGCWLGNALT
jgi:hypothetical protein